MKIKTSELTGAALGYAVAVIERTGIASYNSDSGYLLRVDGSRWWPYEDWAQGGPIIEREKLGVTFEAGWEVPRWSAWGAGVDEPRTETYAGDTPLIAAMRCFVASKLGDEVEIPKELV